MKVGAGGALAVVGVAALGCAGPAAVELPLEPVAPVADAPAVRGSASFTRRVAEVVSHEGRLWARGAEGTLGALDVARAELRRDLPGETVVDLHEASDDSLLALTLASTSDDVRLWRRVGGGWAPEAQMASPAAAILGLADLAGSPVVLTSRSVFVLRAGAAPQATTLAVRLPTAVSAFAVTDDGVGYIGVDSEVEGALLRLDLRTGDLNTLDRAHVTGIIVDPNVRDCALVGVGQRSPRRGRLLRVCDRATSVVWRHSLPSGEDEEAVVALAPARDGFWMVTDDGVYRARGRSVVRHDIPQLVPRAGLAVGSLPGAWLVAAEAGGPPLVAAAASGETL